MSLSEQQRAAILRARIELQAAGIDVPASEPLEADIRPFLEVFKRAEASPSRPPPSTSYRPPPAHVFTDTEIHDRQNRLNRETTVDGLVDHPLGALVEFPETGSSAGKAVAHRFRIDPSAFQDPKDNIQYSLGDGHGGHKARQCYFLRSSSTGKPVPCKHLRTTCRSVKTCNFRPDGGSDAPTATCDHLDGGGMAWYSSSAIARSKMRLDYILEDEMHESYGPSRPAEQQVFEKTLGFYCALRAEGCRFRVQEMIGGTRNLGTSFSEPSSDGGDDNDNVSVSPASSDSEVDNLRTLVAPDARRHPRDHCPGKIVMVTNSAGRSWVQCEYRRKNARCHLHLADLTSFDNRYLKALFDADTVELDKLELAAQARGYGPRAPCNYTEPSRSQRQQCPYWHRSKDGILMKGELDQATICSAVFDIYIPHEDYRVLCPFVVISCRNPHSHPPPVPTKTPRPILDALFSMLEAMQWRLADATPRKIMLDTGFVLGLRQHLAWNMTRDPSLCDLHPSLGNQDHVTRIIDSLRKVRYPSGTDFAGSVQLAREHSQLDLRERYVRVAKEVSLGDKKTARVVVCMLPSMSQLLLGCKRPTIDTSFKRVAQWQEFEIQAWMDNSLKSVVCARAFTTSQSAEAHLLLFQLISEVVEVDCGQPLRLFHIHGEGIEVVLADAHKGQALGFGMFCQRLCQTLPGNCAIQPDRTLASLTPYEHLARCYRLCYVHFKRGIWSKRTKFSADVRHAMLSLASADEVPDFEALLCIIRRGGKTAKAWLEDKEKTPFFWPGIYRPKSLISRDRWLAAPPDTNGNEQSHRDINRDGVHLSLLGGIELGMRYDARAMASYDLYRDQGVRHRDAPSTHEFRSRVAVTRATRTQKRTIDNADAEALRLIDVLEQLHPRIDAEEVHTTVSDGTDEDQRKKRLKTLLMHRESLRDELQKQLALGSGMITPPQEAAAPSTTSPAPPALAPAVAAALNGDHVGPPILHHPVPRLKAASSHLFCDHEPRPRSTLISNILGLRQ
ncbi:hypothetical protein BV25DRAFT_1949705 [Artomyces pyxidatus]|uniref:Uncharacterized protein n=1 Tax=Artomyces pyxidatus TaxID=48021 RepID=A0ACB8SCW0_9AGAM|nr:hypothetical protein BV25DRAFT_1949705 [Artomyces pyxidatus]